MIRLGLSDSEKDKLVTEYCNKNNIRKVFILSPEESRFKCSFYCHEHIEYEQIIQYKYYYRILQEVDDNTLVIVNECLRTQDRNSLYYNCIRNYLNQTKHQIVFQYLPIIDTFDDFMILFDLDTRSRWKRDKWMDCFRSESDIDGHRVDVSLRSIEVPTSESARVTYEKEKRKLINGIGLKDPNTIPRNLHLISGKHKLKVISRDCHYVGRNNRFGIQTMHTYKDNEYPTDCTVFEYCHNFINFGDFLARSKQVNVPVLVSDLKVDAWYHQRYVDWVKRIKDAYAAIYG